jgi:hypothetical protein
MFGVAHARCEIGRPVEIGAGITVLRLVFTRILHRLLRSVSDKPLIYLKNSEILVMEFDTSGFCRRGKAKKPARLVFAIKLEVQALPAMPVPAR